MDVFTSGGFYPKHFFGGISEDRKVNEVLNLKRAKKGWGTQDFGNSINGFKGQKGFIPGDFGRNISIKVAPLVKKGSGGVINSGV